MFIFMNQQLESINVFYSDVLIYDSEHNVHFSYSIHCILHAKFQMFWSFRTLTGDGFVLVLLMRASIVHRQ